MYSTAALKLSRKLLHLVGYTYKMAYSAGNLCPQRRTVGGHSGPKTAEGSMIYHFIDR